MWRQQYIRNRAVIELGGHTRNGDKGLSKSKLRRFVNVRRRKESAFNAESDDQAAGVNGCSHFHAFAKGFYFILIFQTKKGLRRPSLLPESSAWRSWRLKSKAQVHPSSPDSRFSRGCRKIDGQPFAEEPQPPGSATCGVGTGLSHARMLPFMDFGAYHLGRVPHWLE